MEAPPSEYRTPNAEFDYDQIKQLARQERRRVTDYLALARHHDPFYAGCGFRKRNAEWFADLWGRLGFGHGVHLRRIHYVLVSGTEDGSPIAKPNGDPYRNTDNDWDLLGDASLNARYLELIPPDALVDRRNDEPMIFAPEAPDGTARIDLENRWPSVGYIEDPPELPSLDLSGLEPERDRVVEVWIEKSTQNDWLVPLCRGRGVNLVVGVGEMSEVLTFRLVDRVRETGKPTHVIYISDFDPAGRSMPVAAARKVEFHLRRPGAAGHVTLNPLILTEEQCRRYRLPRVPIKESEARRGGFEQMFGAGATELDALEALHPGEMAKLVGGEIDRHIDPTFERRFASSWSDLRLRLDEIEEEVTERHREPLDMLLVEYGEIVGAAGAWQERAKDLWAAISEDLAQEKPDLSEIEMPTPGPAAGADDDVLFDSRRDYLDQMDAYRAWQGRGHDACR